MIALNSLVILRDVGQLIRLFPYLLRIIGILLRKGYSIFTAFLDTALLRDRKKTRSGAGSLPKPKVRKGVQEKRKRTTRRGNTACCIW